MVSLKKRVLTVKYNEIVNINNDNLMINKLKSFVDIKVKIIKCFSLSKQQ